MKTKTKKQIFTDIKKELQKDLSEVDCMMDDYFEAEANECGMKWFSFNEEKKKADDELVRVSVWSLDANCFDVEEMVNSKYVWLGDVVAKLDKTGKLIYNNNENAQGLIAGELFELFKGFCGGKVACVCPNVVEVKINL